VLTLRNGDLLAATRITLDPVGLRLDLPGGGSLHVPREQLATLEPRRTGALASVTDLDDLLAGADGAPGWVRTVTGCEARALPATLARQGVLSERVRVVLEVPAAPPPDLWLYLFTDSTAQPAGDSYALSLQGDAVALERQYAKGPPRPIGTCRLAPPANAVCSVTLTADLAQGHFRLETPAGLGGDWTDAGTDAPTGRGLALVCLKLPAELRRLTVTRLPSADAEVAVAAASPTVDRVYLENGDRSDGEIVAISAAAWSVRRPTSPVPLQIPAAAVCLARFRAAAVAPAATTPGIAVRLYSGSRFKAASVSIQENHLRVRSPAWGEAEFPLADVQELRFVTP
jgi:hypothetical protein